jgi:hypothetical protein
MIAFNRTVGLAHVAQRTDCDCVVATAAIVANVPYSEAAAVSPVQPGARAMYPREIRSLLHKTTTIRWWGPCYAWFRSLTTLSNSSTTLVLSIRRPMTFRDFLRPRVNYHCIAVLRGMILDPELAGPMRNTDYARKDWTVVGYYSPWNRRALESIQRVNAAKWRSERVWSELFQT